MVGLSPKRRVLMVGGEGVVLYAPQGRGIARETALAWDVPNFDEQLVEVLSEKNSDKSVVVIFDGLDQTYRKEENVPKLSPFDRSRFVKRKLELAFPSYPVRAALEIKPPKKKGIQFKAGPKVAPSYLFVALPETEGLDRVGNALFESGVPVAGFGLLPVESAELVMALREKAFDKSAKPSRWAVLIGQHETGGLRQVVARDGQLAMSRLTPTSEAGVSGAGWAEEVTRGFKETLAYISRLGYTPEDGLDVMVVCGELEKQFFDAGALQATQFKCLGVGEALTLIGAKSFGFEKSNFGDALHAAWVARQNSLRLPVRLPSIHRIMAPRLGARVATVLLFLSALGVAGWTANDYTSYLSLREELGIKDNQRAMMQRDYDEETKKFDELEVRPEVIKNTLAIKKLLEDNTANPAKFLNRFRAALGGDIYLQEFKYEHTPGAGLQIGKNSSGPQQNRRGGRRSTPKKDDRGMIKVTFSLALPSSMALEQKVTRAEKLQQDLATAFPDYEVRIATQFGRVSRGGAFQGGAGGSQSDGSSGTDSAVFVMEGEPL
ncbi:MAG: hypothetical protein OXT65_11795 [Alphaproteobacteria bacterium]|nr:hypothetical protein [Alphaproteobacteria bacterium]